jgi:hypothetical protein
VIRDHEDPSFPSGNGKVSLAYVLVADTLAELRAQLPPGLILVRCSATDIDLSIACNRVDMPAQSILEELAVVHNQGAPLGRA